MVLQTHVRQYQKSTEVKYKALHLGKHMELTYTISQVNIS